MNFLQSFLRRTSLATVFIPLLLFGTLVGCDSPTEEAIDTSPTVESADTAADWQEIEGAGVQLSLPESYAGGNPQTDIAKIREELLAINPEYEERVNAIEQNAGNIALLAFDTTSADPQFLTNVNITGTQAAENITLEQYLEAITAQLGSIYEVQSSEVTQLDEYPAARIIAEANSEEATIKQLFYIIQEDNQFWIVSYATTGDEFEARLPEFEQSIQSFALL